MIEPLRRANNYQYELGDYYPYNNEKTKHF